MSPDEDVSEDILEEAREKIDDVLDDAQEKAEGIVKRTLLWVPRLVRFILTGKK